MIQRIQSVYLFISVVICFILSFLTLGHFSTAENQRLSIWHLKNLETGSVIQWNWLLIFFLAVFVTLQFIAIFSFNNRPRQVRMTSLSLVILVALVVLVLLYGDIYPLLIAGQSIPEVIDFSWNMALFILPWVATYMAIRSIRKDETLVRSADRLR